MTVRPSQLARWLAPVALLACTLAVVVILKSSANGSGSSSATTTTSGTAAKAATSKPGTTAGKPKRKRATYTVKPGDTLSAIAEKTGVALSDLQAYNPKLDTQALQNGQKIKLRP